MKSLRVVEGSLRGLNRTMTQHELARAIAVETGTPISQSYLSQIECGARPHLTNTTRLLLAKFFRVHPGYLVEDPEGYHAELLSDLRGHEDRLDVWLVAGSDRFRNDAEVCQALHAIAQQKDPRRCVLLLASILEAPALTKKLMDLLQPLQSKKSATKEPGAKATAIRKKSAVRRK